MCTQEGRVEWAHYIRQELIGPQKNRPKFSPNSSWIVRGFTCKKAAQNRGPPKFVRIILRDNLKCSAKSSKYDQTNYMKPCRHVVSEISQSDKATQRRNKAVSARNAQTIKNICAWKLYICISLLGNLFLVDTDGNIVHEQILLCKMCLLQST